MIYESTDHAYKKNTNLNDPSHPCTNIRKKMEQSKGTVSAFGEGLRLHIHLQNA